MWARIQDGVVAEIVATDPAGNFHPSLIWVDLMGQNDVAPGWTYNAGSFSPPAPVPAASPAQQASVRLAGSTIALTSVTNLSLGGRYTIDTAHVLDMIALETSLAAGKGFPPGGVGSLAYPDASGIDHVFGETDFANFAAAVRDYTYALKRVMQGGTDVLPSTDLTIP